MEIKVHFINEDGLPNMENLTGRVAFCCDGELIEGWPVPGDGETWKDGDVWEAASSFRSGSFSNVVVWIEFPCSFMDFELMALAKIDEK